MSAGTLSPDWSRTMSPGTISWDRTRTTCPSRSTVDFGSDDLPQGLDRRLRLGLLEKPDYGVDQHHRHDDAGVDPLLKQGGDQARGEQNVDQRLVKLRQKLQNRVPPPARRHLIGAEMLQAMFYVESREPNPGVAVQQFDDLLGGKTMPMSTDQCFHMFLLG
jgi:hypothetical protein